MDYKVLYRKYRPSDFSSIIGQDYMVSILKNAIKKDKISHAYIFSGPRGTGKTSTAKVFAKAINCLNPTENGPCNKCPSCLSFKENADIIEIDAASNNGVDEIREIINNIKLAPAYSKYKVYIIDEVHMLSTSAFNALLLTLEEPPKHVVFILATTNIEAVPITILSRCQRFDFHKISLDDILKRLNFVVHEENIAIDDEALEEIAYISDGGMRDALSILDQLSSNTNKITINDVISHFGSASKKQITDLYNCIVKNDVAHFEEMMQNFKKLAIDYKLLIKKLLEKIEYEAIQNKKNPNYQGLSYENLKTMAFELASISNYVNINIDPYLLIEITLLKYFHNKLDNTPIKEEQKLINESKVSINTVKKSPAPKEIIENSSQNITPASDESSKPMASAPKEEANVTAKPSTNLENSELSALIKVRINNCFVSATKNNLQEIKSKWPEYISKLSDKTLLNLIIDCNIVAASDTIAILTNKIDSTVPLINNNLDNISATFNKITNLDYKFVALNENAWNDEKATYISNLKNKIPYTYESEPIIKKAADPPKIDGIEEVAFNIFDKDKIEIE